MARTSRKTAKKTRKKRTRFQTVVTLFCVIVALSLALAGALIYLRHQNAPIENDSLNFFAVKSITVHGNSRYDEAAVIGESGLRVGQSIFSVNKGAAAKKLKETFPYIHEAVLKSPTYDSLEIHITETNVIGAMYGGGMWLVVGENGKILENIPMTSDRPGRYFYLQGAVHTGDTTPGTVAMDERSVGIVRTVLDAVETNAIDGILGIDMRDKTNISLNWKNRLTVVLGNETNLKNEIALFAKTLPQILERNGGVLEGRLDLSSYSDHSEDNDKIVYTPQDVWDAAHKTTVSTTAGTTLSGDLTDGTTAATSANA